MSKQKREERRERMRQRMKERSSNREEGSGRRRKPLFDFSDYEEKPKWYSIKEGKNELDIIPFVVSKPNIVGNGTEEGDEFYVLPLAVHQNIGPKNDRVLCLLDTLGKPCPICEAKKDLLDQDYAWDSDEVSALHSKNRCFYNIIDVSDSEEGIILLEQSEWKFDKEIFDKAEYKGEEFVTFSDLEDGRTVTFRGSKSSFTMKKRKISFVEPKDFDFEDRDPYKEDILEDTYPLDELLIVPTYDEVRNLLLGLGTEEEEGEEKKEEKTEKKRGNTRKSKTEEKPEEKEEKSTGRRSRRGKKEEPEPEDTDGEEDIGKCPFDHAFGIDNDEKESCENCEQDKFDECEARFHEIEKEIKKEDEEKKKEEKPTSRRSSRRNKSR